DVKADRTKAGMRAALERGRWTFKPPVGYRRGERGGPSLVLDPDRAPVVKQAFIDFARGWCTITEVQKRLRVAGLKSHHGTALAKSTVQSLLRCQLYIGRVDVPDWGIAVAGDFEALVSEDIFNQVQVRLGPERTSVAKYIRENPDFPLRGL